MNTGKRVIIGVIALCLTVVLCFGMGGCAVGQVNENIPEEYRKIFVNGSFDETTTLWASDDQRYSEMIADLHTFCGEESVGSVLVATDKEIIFAGGFNAVEVDGETTVNPFTTYEIGSMTKQITAAAILQQAAKGNLSVDDTLDKFFPDYPEGSKVKVDNLLHMDSGIEEFLRTPQYFRGATQEEKDAFSNGQMSDEDVLSYLYKLPLNYTPGQLFSYSNTNYYLLALILEKASGMPYEEYIRENIFDVCGMANSTCVEVGNITSVPFGELDMGYMKTQMCCRGAGDIHSNVCDILLWDRALLSGGKILDSEQLDYMTELRKGYSCGWMSEAADQYIGHAGSTWSYVSQNTVFFSEELGNVYVIQMCPDYTTDSIKMISDLEEIVRNHIF